ncbi:Malate dehydrogenase [Thelohanellus kitauei]|uniref:Malate dehydrogenase, mitochondrial n=1 Tax=Thelohanellus kitauei TaxID=669202 RepID=A0A0C2MPI9_THEKT|nr:Malate dehydrogenase [Thelohanellus kitauei]
MSRDDLFKTNANIVGDVMVKIMESKQYPHVAIITNPINSIVPFACKISQLYDRSDQSVKFTKKIYGITCLDSIRASTFLANHLGKNPADVVVPVIGGHSDTTIVPLFSLSNFPVTDLKVVEDLVKQVREAGTRVVEAKKGAGSATLSMAFAAHRFVSTLTEMYYNKTTSDCAFIYHPSFTNQYGARVCVFDEGCVKDTVPLESITEYEHKLFIEAEIVLKKDIEKGLEYADIYALDHPSSHK